jgi:hypothetical protein
MKKNFFITVLPLLPLYILAQDQTIKTLQVESNKTVKAEVVIDTTKTSWKTGGLYNLSIGQGTLSNWAAGGDDFSLTINSLLNLFCFYRKHKNSWDNSLDISLGYLKTTSLGSRKNDDRFDLLSKYGYALNSKLNISTLFNFRSQFLKGYTYPNNKKTFSSSYLAPGYVLLSLGLDYKPAKNLSIFLSPFTSRWVIVKNDSLSAKGSYGVDTGRKSISQLGAFSTINYRKDLNKYVSYKARIDLFSNYKKNPLKVDFNMTNVLSVKLARFLSINWTIDMIYDDDTRLFGKNKSSPALQLKSIIGIGLLVRFLSRSS